MLIACVKKNEFCKIYNYTVILISIYLVMSILQGFDIVNVPKKFILNPDGKNADMDAAINNGLDGNLDTDLSDSNDKSENKANYIKNGSLAKILINGAFLDIQTRHNQRNTNMPAILDDGTIHKLMIYHNGNTYMLNNTDTEYVFELKECKIFPKAPEFETTCLFNIENMKPVSDSQIIVLTVEWK